MGHLKNEWGIAKAQAERALGQGAEVPELAPAIEKAAAVYNEKTKAFEAAQQTMSEALMDLDNANSAVQNALEAFRAAVDRNSFNKDSKADAKAVAGARKGLVGFIDQELVDCKGRDKVIDDLTRHVTQLGKYRP